MWTAQIVISGVLVHDAVQMLLIENDELVQTFLTDCPHPAFSKRIGIRCSERRGNNVNGLAFKDRIKFQGEFTIMIVNQVANGRISRFQFPGDLAGLLYHPVGSGMIGAACKIDSARSMFDEKEFIQGLQG